MSLTFGTIIADRDLQLVGLKSLMLGIFLSILFGFIFGLILGTTQMPWGYNDWPTDEMKGRCVSRWTTRHIAPYGRFNYFIIFYFIIISLLYI